MLRALIGWVLGFVCGVIAIPAFAGPEKDVFWVAVVAIVASLAFCLTFAHKHHLKKRKEYYDKLTKSWSSF